MTSSKVEVMVNNQHVPLNRFVKNLITKVVTALVSSLKEVNAEDLEEINITVKFTDTD